MLLLCLANLAQVVQRMDKTIQRMAWCVLSTLIAWVVIYPVESVIQPSNNQGLEEVLDYSKSTAGFETQ